MKKTFLSILNLSPATVIYYKPEESLNIYPPSSSIRLFPADSVEDIEELEFKYLNNVKGAISQNILQSSIHASDIRIRFENELLAKFPFLNFQAIKKIADDFKKINVPWEEVFKNYKTLIFNKDLDRQESTIVFADSEKENSNEIVKLEDLAGQVILLKTTINKLDFANTNMLLKAYLFGEDFIFSYLEEITKSNTFQINNEKEAQNILDSFLDIKKQIYSNFSLQISIKEDFNFHYVGVANGYNIIAVNKQILKLLNKKSDVVSILNLLFDLLTEKLDKSVINNILKNLKIALIEVDLNENCFVLNINEIRKAIQSKTDNQIIMFFYSEELSIKEGH